MKGVCLGLAAALLSASAVFVAVDPAHAQTLNMNKCAAKKLKCVEKLSKKLFKCHEKAEKKGLALDPACVQKALDKFDGGADPANGCFANVEAKGSCATINDTAVLRADVEAFVNAVVAALDPGFPVPIQNKCSAKKKKCVSKKAGCILKAYTKVVKSGLAPAAADLTKCLVKFDGGATPEKGCFAKLEAKYASGADACLTFDDAAALEAMVDAFTANAAGALEGPCSLQSDPDLEPGTRHCPPASPSCDTCDAETRDVGYRVYGHSGEFYLAADDLRIPGRGHDFVWARKYRSKIGPDTPQGIGWDFSYNIYLEASATCRIVHDGNARADVYTLQPDGTWTRPELFRRLERNGDGTYTLWFADRSRWNFHPLDGAPDAGKIATSVDRNGNSLSFTYDDLGRLITITDTLHVPGQIERSIAVTYDDVSGRITDVTDFAGRNVHYEYYTGEPGGSPGDLKSVTYPAVVGTSTGNDFPAGKTWSYTYSTGFLDPRLNHNLLTITDGRRNDPLDPTFDGGPFLINIYAGTTVPSAAEFDRVVAQVWGNQGDLMDPAGDRIDLVYVAQAPAPGNNQAVIKVIENDRMGHVREQFYDGLNRLVRLREWLRAAPNPNLPTTDTSNTPTVVFRADEPAFADTDYSYNADARCTLIIHPNGNVTEMDYQLDLAPGAPWTERGNLRAVRRLEGTYPVSGDQEELVETFTHWPGLGSCGTRFVATHTDARGNTTSHTYDAAGNRIETTHRIPAIVEDFEYNVFGQLTAHVLPANGAGGAGTRRRDEYTYYDTTTPQHGYRSAKIVDAGGFGLTTTYDYDTVGNVVSMIDPRGHDTLYEVNALNQVVRETSREVTTGSGQRHTRDTIYDANNNVIRSDTYESLPLTVASVRTSYAYDILNVVTQTTRMRDPLHNVVTQFEYDANRNRTLTRYGEAVNGNQPENTLREHYDGRDLLFRSVRAEGTALQSTTQHDYDGNRNLKALREGMEDTLEPRLTLHVYDAFDRRLTTTDAMGNVTHNQYDPNGNLARVIREGERVDVIGSALNVTLLSDGTGAVVERYEYDDFGRPLTPTSAPSPLAVDPSTAGNPFLFTGRRYDPETGWYYYRTRYLDPRAGRFTTRDMLGIWGDEMNAGNAYGYVGGRPWSVTDPHGLAVPVQPRTKRDADRLLEELTRRGFNDGRLLKELDEYRKDPDVAKYVEKRLRAILEERETSLMRLKVEVLENERRFRKINIEIVAVQRAIKSDEAWIADLDHDDPKTQERATKYLLDLGGRLQGKDRQAFLKTLEGALHKAKEGNKKEQERRLDT